MAVHVPRNRTASGADTIPPASVGARKGCAAPTGTRPPLTARYAPWAASGSVREAEARRPEPTHLDRGEDGQWRLTRQPVSSSECRHNCSDFGSGSGSGDQYAALGSGFALAFQGLIWSSTLAH